MTKKLSDLTPNPNNPRKITDEKKAMLKKSLAEFGDLSGVVFNRETSQLAGGHQRVNDFREANPAIVCLKEYDPPNKVGTVLWGYFEIDGERFTYREVVWSKKKETAANMAANKGAGEWNYTLLGEQMIELDDGSFDMDTTMFDETERERLVVGWDSGDSVEKVEVNLDANRSTIKVKCAKDIEDEVRLILKRAILETSFEGVEVV